MAVNDDITVKSVKLHGENIDNVEVLHIPQSTSPVSTTPVSTDNFSMQPRPKDMPLDNVLANYEHPIDPIIYLINKFSQHFKLTDDNVIRLLMKRKVKINQSRK